MTGQRKLSGWNEPKKVSTIRGCGVKITHYKSLAFGLVPVPPLNLVISLVSFQEESTSAVHLRSIHKVLAARGYQPIILELSSYPVLEETRTHLPLSLDGITLTDALHYFPEVPRGTENKLSTVLTCSLIHLY